MDGRDLTPEPQPGQNTVVERGVLPESAEPGQNTVLERGVLPAGGPFPLRGAAVAVLAVVLGAIVSMLVGGVAYVAFGEAQAPSIVAGSLGLYGVMTYAVVRSSRRWGSGDVRNDVGLRLRPADLGWGLLTWLGAFGSVVVIGMIIDPFEQLQGSNTDVLTDDPTIATIVAMSFVAVVLAPLFEELLFRGLLLRSLASALPGPLAVAVQGLAFGLVHFQPDEGLGNVGIVVSLGAVGAAFGVGAYLSRRLGPAIVGHAIFNAVATVATLVSS